eukprot:TRINITY_DN6420_c0_g1_i1.p1 TRINITY_DN6420_c0_g1~~TRINITY_DN6420_c0_g1_i1.p1  ORF type:complete len:168 (-),score=6.40 TRINITY_DN6420_c0_g1_i1:41-544(-)
MLLFALLFVGVTLAMNAAVDLDDNGLLKITNPQGAVGITTHNDTMEDLLASIRTLQAQVAELRSNVLWRGGFFLTRAELECGFKHCPTQTIQRFGVTWSLNGYGQSATFDVNNYHHTSMAATSLCRGLFNAIGGEGDGWYGRLQGADKHDVRCMGGVPHDMLSTLSP